MRADGARSGALRTAPVVQEHAKGRVRKKEDDYDYRGFSGKRWRFVRGP
jgi:hypothetical protein